MSPSSNKAAFCFDEDNNVAVFDTNSKEILFKLMGNNSIITNIVFQNENEIFVSSDDKNINYYNLKEPK